AGAGRTAAPAPSRRRQRDPSSLLADQLSPHEPGARRERPDLLVAHVPRAPAKAAVRVHGQLLGAAHFEDPPGSLGDLLGLVLVEALDVDDPGAQLAALAVLPPEIHLRHLAPGELEHELVGARLQEPGEIRGVGTVEARAAETIAEADVKGAARLDTLGRHVEEPRHLLARDVAARRFVDLDEVGARRDETLQLLVDDLGEALRHVDHALVHLAGVDAGPERQRPRARGLGAPARVRPEDLELLGDAEPAGRRPAAPDRRVARRRVVAPGPCLA